MRDSMYSSRSARGKCPLAEREEYIDPEQFDINAKLVDLGAEVAHVAQVGLGQGQPNEPIAAAIEATRPPGKVLLVPLEDPVKLAVAPRLHSAGADQGNVIILRRVAQVAQPGPTISTDGQAGRPVPTWGQASRPALTKSLRPLTPDP